MASTIDTAQVERRLLRLAAKKRNARVAAAAFSVMVGPTGALAKRVSGGDLPPNAPRYAAWKLKHGRGGRPLVSTGGLLKALSTKLREKYGTAKGMKFAQGTRPTLHAYLQPRTFGKAVGRGGKKTDQWKALGAVDFGTKKAGRGKGHAIRQRRLLEWRQTDEAPATRALEREFQQIAKEEGF